jgi:acetyl esterase/lipase
LKTTLIYDPEVYATASTFPAVDVADAQGARAFFEKMLKAAAAESGPLVDSRVAQAERTIPGPAGAPAIPIRIYTPRSADVRRPVFVNFHGGAFILGNLETEHQRCLKLAADAGAVAVGVDYRLAPENPFPAGVEDCYAALKWVANNAEALNIDPKRIVIGGGSAGGALTAAVALMARDRGGPALALQMLFYPVIDDRCETASMQAGERTFIWNKQHTLNMWKHYIGTDRSNVSPYASPARASDLSSLASAYIVTCEHDPLRDEGLLYAMRLMQAGVPVELHNYPGTVHGFDLLTPSGVARRALEDCVTAFRRATA